MHLTTEDFETYLSTDNLSAEALSAIEPIQLHLDSCEQCRKTLSHLNIVYHTVSEESLGSSVALLNHELTVRRGLVFTVLYQTLYNALPQEQEKLRKLITDFHEKRYYVYRIDKLEITRELPKLPPLFPDTEPDFRVTETQKAETEKTEILNILDYAALRERLKQERPFSSSAGPFPVAANIVSPGSVETYRHSYDVTSLTVFVTRQVPVSYMILQPEQGTELPQVQPAVYDEQQCYKAVFPLETPSKAYQVLIF